jgi:hypothetical protein
MLALSPAFVAGSSASQGVASGSCRSDIVSLAASELRYTDKQKTLPTLGKQGLENLVLLYLSAYLRLVIAIGP